MPPTPPGNETSDDGLAQSGSDDLRVQQELLVHLAEYNALTMRITYWITLQYACWPIMILFWGLAAQLWSKIPPTPLIWICGFLTEVVVLAWCEAGHEIYNNARYIEHSLSPRIESLLEVKNVWGYESFMKKLRGDRVVWHEYALAVGVTVLFVLAVWYKRPWDYGDWIGASLCGLGIIIIAAKSAQLIHERRLITRSADVEAGTL